MTIHVITAGPSAGKSSVIRELGARGHRTLPEAARIAIDQKISEGVDADEVREIDGFQQYVEMTDRRIERNADSDVTYFSDRSLVDNIVYRRIDDGYVPQELLETCRGRYDTVFMLEQLSFRDDYARDEDAQEAREIHQRLRATYEALGYDVIDVPVMPIDERVDAIESVIGRS